MTSTSSTVLGDLFDIFLRDSLYLEREINEDISCIQHLEQGTNRLLIRDCRKYNE